MFHRQRVTTVALTATAIFGLSGCALIAPPAEEPLTGTAACALGHEWTANLEDLSAQLLTNLQQSGVAATSATLEGNLVLDWSTAGHVVLTTDYTVTVQTAPAADQVLTVVQTHTGEATGAAYINGEVAIPRKWDGSKINVETVADNNGAPVDPVPFAIPELAFDDSVGLELTCSGAELTTHPRGGKITQKWSS